MIHLHRHVLAALALSLAALPGFSQEPTWADVDDARAHFLIVDRNREDMRWGDDDPLRVVGIEQGDNAFRSRTPALESAVVDVARIDRGEAYRRKLAMYETQASFSTPLPVMSSGSSAARDGRLPAPAGSGADAVDPDLASRGNALAQWSWLVALSASGMLLALFLRRHGASLQARGPSSPPSTPRRSYRL